MAEAANIDELRVRGVHTSKGFSVDGGRSQSNVAAKEVLLRLLAQGYRMEEAAKELGRSRHTINNWVKAPGFMVRLKDLNQMVFEKFDQEIQAKAGNTLSRITEASDVALDKILELMETAGSEQVQLKAAQDILDRNPDTSKTHKVQSTETKVTIDATFLQLAATAEKEITIDR